MRKIRIGRVLIFLVAAILVSFACFTLIINLFKGVGNLITSDKMIVASSNLTVPLYDMNFNEVDKITRGTELIVSDKTTNNEKEYYKIKYNKNEYYISVDDLVKEEKDIVKEKEMYVRSSLTLYEDINSIKIKGLVEKGEKVEVLGYDELNSDGSIEDTNSDFDSVYVAPDSQDDARNEGVIGIGTPSPAPLLIAYSLCES